MQHSNAFSAILLIVGVGCAQATPAQGVGGESNGGQGGSTIGGSGGIAGAGGADGGEGGTAGSGGDPNCEEVPCKLVNPQCGCGGGEKCTIDASGAKFCSAAGSIGSGDDCSGGLPCIPGHLCASTSPTVSTCQKFCTEDFHCPGDTGLCLVDVTDQGGQPIPGAKLCTEECTVLPETGCPVTGTKCSISQTAEGVTYTHCTADGLGGNLDACLTHDDCQLGYGCINDACYQWCDVDNPVCDNGICQPFPTPGIIVDDVTYGACL